MFGIARCSVLACLLAISLTVPVTAHADGEVDRQQASQSSDNSTESASFPATDESASAQPPGRSAGIIGLQSLAGAVIGFGSVYGGTILVSEGDVLSFAGLGLVILGPTLLNPIAVNLIGNLRRTNQYSGAHIGTLLGTLAGAGVTIGGMYAAAGPGFFLGLIIGYPILAAAGSVLGYHYQTTYRDSSPDSDEPTVELSPTPLVDPVSRQTGMGLQLQGRF